MIDFMEFNGFLRDNGSVGVRNIVGIIPAGKCANRLAHRIWQAAQSDTVTEPGRDSSLSVFPILHTHPCTFLEHDNRTAFRTLSNIGKNPNLAAVVVVGLGCEQLSTAELAESIAEAQKPVASVTVEESGGMEKAFHKGLDAVKTFLSDTESAERQRFPIEKLTLALKCGGSSAVSAVSCNPALGAATDRLIAAGGSAVFAEILENVGAEHLIEKRATSKAVYHKIVSHIRDMEEQIEKTGFDIRGSEPTKGNIESGLTTIEEKALGALMKTGTTPIVEALDYGEQAVEKGVNFVFTPDDTPELLMAMAASGAQVLVFTTGGGMPARLQRTPAMVGRFDLLPMIRVVGNTHDYEAMREFFDINAGTIIEKTESIVAVGDKILDEVIAVASGKQPAMERMEIDYIEPLKMYAGGPLI